MRIKLAVLEKDQNYLNRLVSVFNTKYSDKLEVYSFTSAETALSTLESTKIDVFLANDIFEIDFSRIPKRCTFAYLVESMDVAMINEKHAIPKYQKADLIYRQILNAYSENAESVSGLKLDDAATRLIAFQPVSGGSGSSTVAAACALHYAAQGMKTLYLNLEKFGSADSFFRSDGQFDMSDIIFAVKSKKPNLALKLESCVKQDPRGVFFFSQSKVALDMMELTTDDILQLLDEFKTYGAYNAIILDMDFSLGKETLKVLRQMHSVVWVGDGSEISNTKLYRAYTALSLLEQNSEAPLTNRMKLIYNRFSTKTSRKIEGLELRNIGGSPRIEATTDMILSQIAANSMFDQVV